jgi:hypothetical protein
LDLKDYLLVGSYLFGASSWWVLWRAIRRIELTLAEQRGKEYGWDHEDRITRLERLIH